MEYERANNKNRNSRYKKIIIIIAVVLLVLSIIVIKEVRTIISITAHYEGNRLIFKGNYYKEYYAHYDASDKVIGYIKYPIDSIYALENDNTYNYLYVTKFTDQYLFVKEGTDIPTSGDVTMVLSNYHTDKAIVDKKDIELIISLEKQRGETFIKDEIPKFTNNVPHFSTIYYCYNNCPISEYKAGTIWNVKGKWVYFSIKDMDKGIVITEQPIVKELERIFSDVYISANE